MRPKRKLSVREDSAEVGFDLLSFSNTSNITDLGDEFNVEILHRISQTIKLPGTMWGVHQKTGNKTAFIHINEDMIIDKTVEFDKSCVPNVKINGSNIELPEVKSKMHLESLLRGVDTIKNMPTTGMSLRKRKLSVDNEKKSTPVNIVQKGKSLKRKLSENDESDSEMVKSPSPPLRITRSHVKNTPKYTPTIRRRPSRNQHSGQEQKNKKLETPKIVKKTRQDVVQIQEKPNIETPVESSEDETPKIVRRKPKLEKDELFGFGVRCIIGSCTNSMLQTRQAGLNISYYRFPMDDTLADKWKIKCNLSGRIPNSARVCSDHFKKEDFEGFETPGSQLVKRELKKKAIPTLHITNKKDPVVLPQKNIRRRKSNKINSGIKVVSTKTLQYTSDSEEEDEEVEKGRMKRASTPVSVASIDLTQHESDDEPIVVDKQILTVELSDDSSESDEYEEVIQVKITHLSAESEESETDELKIVKNRRKVLKKKKPIIEKYGDYEVETLEFELKSDDSDAEVRQMKKTLDAHLNASKSQIQNPHNGLNQTPKINNRSLSNINKDNIHSIEFSAEVESEKIIVHSPPRSQSLAKLLQGKNRPDKETIIKIIEQKISENYDILNNRKMVAPRLETKNDTIYIHKNGKGVIKVDNTKNVQLKKKPLPKPHILASLLPPQPQSQVLTNKENTTPEKPTQFENIVAQLDLQQEDLQQEDLQQEDLQQQDLQQEDIEQKPEETTQVLENENENESFEFVNSNNIIIENTIEDKFDDTPEMDNDQIIIVCKNEEEINEMQEKLQINHDKEMHQTISIQRKSGNEVIPNKLKIPATEHTEELKTEKGILNTLFWNNVSSENIFYTNEDIAKPEVQELLSQNEIDYSKVIVLNNLPDQNVQWDELPDAVKEHVQGNELYYITQEEGSTQVRNQSDSFDENQYLNMECLEVEVVPPEPSGNY